MSLPGGSVEASRAQRIERLQARYRDRGGIFKPADHNPLLDLLLARGVNGESPSRTNSPRRSRSRSTSPRRKQPTSYPPHTEPSEPSRGTNPTRKTRRNSKRKVTDPDGTVDDAQNVLDDMSAPATSPKGRPSKPTKTSTRSKSAARGPPPSDASDNESPLLAPKNRTARQDASNSTKEKQSKPKQPRKRKVPPHVEVLTDHEAPATTSRKKVQKKATNASSSKSKVAVVAKLTTQTERGDDGNPAPARPRRNPPMQSLESDSEQPSVPKKSTRGKLKAKTLEEEDMASQVPSDKATAKKTAKRTKTENTANRQSETSKDLAHAPETDAQSSTSRDTKKRKKPTAAAKISHLLPAGRRARLESDSEKQPPQSRSPSPAPPANEPARSWSAARKRRKAHQAVDDGDDIVTEERQPRIHNRQPSRQLGHVQDAKEMRKVSRSKAPPVPMPNGVRLKPKPRPRLSMFQPPPDDDDDSDRDPIDFLS
ncbi:hypothetical protein LXA43DRAFT_552863 [Ganoderma leucocontextum]|nr:hypothetical protein LXA43DRAFT_552863 [Ganoderma leucocontextum]